MVTSQTVIDLSGITGTVTLGSNCSNSQTPQEFVTTGDLNLNGFTLKLRNANLIVTGNLNGGGSIIGCGSSSNICVTGNIQNNPQLNSNITLNCNSLSTDNFKLNSSNYNFNRSTKVLTVDSIKFINVYDLTGKLIKTSQSNSIILDNLDSGLYLINTNRGNIKLYL